MKQALGYRHTAPSEQRTISRRKQLSSGSFSTGGNKHDVPGPAPELVALFIFDLRTIKKTVSVTVSALREFVIEFNSS